MSAQQHVRRRTADAEIGPVGQGVPPTAMKAERTHKAIQEDDERQSYWLWSLTATFLATAFWSIVQFGPMLGLIFGGCCSNVYTLEGIVKSAPQSGFLITFAQFVLVAGTGYYSNFSLSHPPFFLKPINQPVSRLLTTTALFFSINTLNNYAFGFSISVPVHIILRSGGSVTTMLFGYIWGKRYSRTQVLSVALLTLGVVTAAWTDAKAKGKTQSSKSQTLYSFLTGLGILFVAQLLSAWMGLYVEGTYAVYGNHWRENFFYTHLLSLPLFIPFMPSMLDQYKQLARSANISVSSTTLDYLPHLIGQQLSRIPIQCALLAVNSITQYACIRGVSLLAARSSALTVTIVLNIRKLASLLLSIWLFGNRLAPGIMLGATIVFGAGALYGWETQRFKSRQASQKQTNGVLKTTESEKKS